MKAKTEPIVPAQEAEQPQKETQKVEGTTRSGFAFCYDREALDDMELFDQLDQADHGSPKGAKRAVEILLGREGVSALYGHLRAKDDRVRWTAFYRELVEITNASREGKN